MTHHHHFFEFSFTLHLRFNDKQISISNSRQMDSVIRKKFLSPKKNISTFLFAKERKKKKNSRKTSESNSFHGLKKFSSDCCSTNRATSCKKEKIWTIFHGISRAITIDLTSRYRGQGISKIPCRRKCISFPEVGSFFSMAFHRLVSCVFPFTRPQHIHPRSRRNPQREEDPQKSAACKSIHLGSRAPHDQRKGNRSSRLVKSARARIARIPIAERKQKRATRLSFFFPPPRGSRDRDSEISTLILWMQERLSLSV